MSNQPVNAFATHVPVGQIKTNRGLLKYILLPFVTFGIYHLVFYSSISSDINIVASRYDGKRTMHFCLLFFLIGPITLYIAYLVWYHKLSARIGGELSRRGLDNGFGASTFWLWGVLGILIIIGPYVYVYKLCKAMNMLAEHYNAGDMIVGSGATGGGAPAVGFNPPTPQPASPVAQPASAGIMSRVKNTFSGLVPAPKTQGGAPSSSAAWSSVACVVCGRNLDPGDTFCEDCGTMTGNAPTPAVPAPPAQAAPAAGYNPPAPVQPSRYASPSAYQPPPPIQAPPQPVQPAQPPLPQPIAYAPAVPQQMASSSRMPLVFLLDTSAFASQYIRELNSSLNSFKSKVSQDSLARSILDVSVLQFSDSVNVLQAFAPVGDMKPVRLISGGPAHYSAPIKEALRLVDDFARSQTSSYKPWIILVTGGSPSDDISAVAGELQRMQGADKLRFMALGVQSYNATALKQLTDVVFRQEGTDFDSFFDWISKCIGAIALTSPGEKPKLPPLQGNVYREK